MQIYSFVHTTRKADQDTNNMYTCWYLGTFPGCRLCWYLGFLVVHFVGILVPFPGCGIYFMSFEQEELDGKYSLIGCGTTCVLLCMMLSCLAQTLECCLHCMSLPVIGQGMPVFKWLAVNRWSLSATFRGGKQVCFSFC